MKSATIFALILALLSLTITAPAQRRGSRRARRDVRISKEHPTVYIGFVRVGKAAGDEGESDERVWLRFHNNSIWELSLDASGVADESHDEAKLYYDIEAVPERSESFSISEPIPTLIPLPSGTPPQDHSLPKNVEIETEEDKVVPTGPRCHVCSVIPLGAGRSILFSVPREHLAKNLVIYVHYNYSWERDKSDGVFARSDEPRHSVSFYASNLPEGVR